MRFDSSLIALTLKYYLQNPEFKFVTGLHIYCPGGTITDVVVGVAKVDYALTWDYPGYRMKTLGEWATITFDRPDNWNRFEIQLASDNSNPISGSLIFLEALTETDILHFLKTKKVVFLGAARNCEQRIPGTLAKLLELADLFVDYRLKIYENDSIDQTSAICQAAVNENEKITLVSETGLDKLLPERTQRLAYARNKLLDDTLANHFDFDYICWVDMDGLVDSRFSTLGFLSNFKYHSVWDAVFPVSSPSYYDIWALREQSISPGDIVWRMRHQIPSMISRKDTHTAVQQLGPGSLQGWLSVDSAFGGLGLYTVEAASQGRYIGVVNNEGICEHVPYHQGLIRSGARLYVNPECMTHNP